MRPRSFPAKAHARHILGACLAFAVLLTGPGAALAEPSHGIAMHGEPALPGDFDHLPYVNPDAPKGGSITYGVIGTFDSTNPFILKSMRTTSRGVWDFEFGNLVYETLLYRSRDEAFTMYGLLAESVETPEDRSWVSFSLNPDARWSDGMPVTVEDVIFSFELLAEKGRPPYSNRMDKISKIEKIGDRTVKFWLNEKSDREFPLIIGLTPILPSHAIDPDTFAESTLEAPLGSGPYRVTRIDPGQRLVFERNPDYWARDIPSKKGMNNYDRVTIEYFREANTLFEAFKKGLVDVYRDGDPAHWERAYDFPAVERGDVVKDVFPTEKPANMLAFVFNTRKPVFRDPMVREALAMLFDFEWTNKNLFFDAYKRTGSFWHGSELSSLARPADDRERKLLSPFPEAVSESVMEGTYAPPVADGSGRDRKVMRRAFRMLKKAGFSQSDGALRNAAGMELSFEILTKNKMEEQLASAYKRVLDRIGINATIRSVDDAQYQRRTQSWDYDMIVATYSSASLSPGAEQTWRWSSRSRDLEGTFNYAGANDPAIDALIEELISAKSKEDFVATVRALDRVLISGHYVVPLFHLDEQWIARWNHIKPPEETPIYGAQFETWWDARAAE